MATITVTRNTAVYTPPKKPAKAPKKPVRKAEKRSESKAEKPEPKNRTANPKAEQKSVPEFRTWHAFDAVKLQNDILKAANKHDAKHSNMEWGYAICGSKIIVTEGHAAWFIPKGNWYLNIETVFRGKAPYQFDAVTEGWTKAEKIELTAEIKKLNDGREVRVFKNPNNGEEIWINSAFLKLYDLERLQFEGTNKISPIYISEYDELVGVVLPINH